MLPQVPVPNSVLKSGPNVFLSRLFERVHVVGGEKRAAGGVEVHGERNDAGRRIFFAGFREQDDADLRIDGAGGADDFGTVDRRVEADGAVLHVEAAIEREAILVA